MATRGYGGKTLKKTVKVLTDDPNNGQIPLTITGRVFEIYTLSDRSINLTGVAGEKILKTVQLSPSRDYPFTVKEITARHGENIRFQLEKIVSGEDIRYEVTVENTKTNPGIYFDTLYLKTDSDIKPEIEIQVVGKIMAATDGATG